MNYFFWFLLFLTVPIIVHLFNFRRAKKLWFTNVKFIRKVSTETKSKTRLKHLLILSSRVLTFLFLIAAFILSLLKLNSNELTQIDSMGSFYLDNSSSAVGNSINDERIFIDDLISSKKANTGFFLTNNFSAFSNNERTKTEILQKAENLNVSYASRSIEEVLARINSGNDTYLISDFQSSTTEELNLIRQDSITNYFLVYKELQKLRNAYVDSVWLVRDLDDYSNLLLNCKIGYSENYTEGSVVVKLLDENGNQISSVVKGMESDLLVEFSVSQNKTSAFEIQISGDEIEFDNQFYLTITKRRSPSILILSQTSNRYLSNIFSNESLFDLTVSGSDIDYELLSTVDLVVVNDYYQLPAGLISQNSEDVAFFIIPADSIDQSNYESEMGYKLEPQSELGMLEIQLVKGNKLMNGVYKSIAEDASFPQADNKYNILGVHEKILALRNGRTFLGKDIASAVYFLSTPLKDEYTNFPNHSIFLPLMYRIADETLEIENTLFAYPNSFIAVSDLSPDAPPKMVSDGVEIIPEFNIGNQGGLVKVPNDLAPGFYHIVQGRDTINSFGLNLSKEESLIDGPTLGELENFFKDSEHVKVIPITDEQNSSILELNDGDSLWKYALILALIFILLETMFHRYLK